MPGRHTARRTARHLGAVSVAAAILLVPAGAIAGVGLPSPSPSAAPAQAGSPVQQDTGALLDELTDKAAAVQDEFISATTRYEQAKAAAITARSMAAKQQELATKQQAQADAKRDAVNTWVASMYRNGPLSNSPVLMALLSSKTNSPSDFVNGLGSQVMVANHKGAEFAAASEAADTARASARQADQARKNADAAEQRAQKILDDIQQKAAAVSSQLSETLAEVGSQLAVANAEQQARNEAALKSWRTYLGTLAAAKIVTPGAGSLINPAHLPKGMSPALGKDGKPVPGVATIMFHGKSVTILPRETINAVSSAFTELGRPYAPASTGPDAFDCAGLVSSAWRVARPAFSDKLTDQFQHSRSVPGDQIYVGDLIFQADPKAGLHNVGIYVGGGMMINASAVSNQVSVTPVTSTPALVTRLTLPTSATPNPLPSATGGLKMTCGQVEMPHYARAVGAGANNHHGRAAWGGFPNGMIPPNLLCAIKSAPSQRLRCDAAKSFDLMSAAYEQVFHTPICITDSYRDYPSQVDVYARKPGLAAIPGTSNHGWALATDLCGGIEGFTTPQHLWMLANAPRFGFEHPEWAEPTGSKPEAWHWEYGDIS